MTVCGMGGPASNLVAEQGIALGGGGELTHADCSRFYPDASSSSFHVAGPRTVTVADVGNGRHDGYFFFIVFNQRHGLSHEVVWLYQESDGGSGGGGGDGEGDESDDDGSSSDTARCTLGLAAVGVVVLRRTKKRWPRRPR